jgi:hypothetical protein
VGYAEDIQKHLLDAVRKAIAGSSFALSFDFPIAKVNEATREVEGVATSEALDSHGEILTYEGSVKAMTSWRGNVREMHAPVAVGKALDIRCDDARKQIIVKSYISKGAQATFEKVLDGTLSYYSVGGTRTRSIIRDDGVRETSAWTCGELSLVDSGANPDSRISLVKMVGGRPTATEVLEERMSHEGEVLAGAARAVAETLKSGLRPLPSEVQRLLDAASRFSCEGALRCDSISQRDWRVLGPQIAKDLLVVADAASIATEASDLAKIASAAEGLMVDLLTKKDLAAGRFSKAVVSSRMSLSKGSQQLFTDAELEERYQFLLAARDNWAGTCCHAGRTCRHFKELEEKLFIVVHLKKFSRGEAVCGQRGR